ncbi:unnamed protein product [Eretmochelys imbricata]
MAHAENERSKTVKRQGVKEAEQGTERGRERERERERRWTDPAACALLLLEKVSSEPGSLQLAPRTPAKPGFTRAVQRPSSSLTTPWNSRTMFIRKDKGKQSVASSLPSTPCSFSSQQAYRAALSEYTEKQLAIHA